MRKEDRSKRIIARGEGSNHAHIVTGEATIIRNDKGETIIELGKEEVFLKHLLETSWLEGREQFTGEHAEVNLSEIDKLAEIGDIPVRQGDVALEKIAPGRYKYIPQVEYDPYDDVIRQVKD